MNRRMAVVLTTLFYIVLPSQAATYVAADNTLSSKICAAAANGDIDKMEKYMLAAIGPKETLSKKGLYERFSQLTCNGTTLATFSRAAGQTQVADALTPSNHLEADQSLVF